MREGTISVLRRLEYPSHNNTKIITQTKLSCRYKYHIFFKLIKQKVILSFFHKGFSFDVVKRCVKKIVKTTITFYYKKLVQACL